MFGVPRSINILNKINSFISRDKNRNKYRVIITPPYTLLESFAKKFKNKKIMITYIKGRLIEKTPTKIVVESSGIGYEINISLNTFERILKKGEKKTGCTVHFVNEKLDAGKIILKKFFMKIILLNCFQRHFTSLFLAL